VKPHIRSALVLIGKKAEGKTSSTYAHARLIMMMKCPPHGNEEVLGELPHEGDRYANPLMEGMGGLQGKVQPQRLKKEEEGCSDGDREK